MSTVSNVVLPKEKKVRVKKADVAVLADVPKSPSPKKVSTPKPATPKPATPKPATPKSDAEAEKKEVKPRKPTLSAKYTKFIVFGYSVVNALVAAGLVSDEQIDAAYAQIKLMDSVEDQTAFYSGFLENLSASGKAMKKFVADKKKPPKEPKAAKERKPRAKSEPKATKTKAAKSESEPEPKEAKSESESEAPKEKKSRVKKAKADSETKVSESKVSKEKKPRAKKNVTVESDAAADVISNLVAAANNHNNNDDDDDDDEVIHTRETIIDGQSFLIDQDNNLYDPSSHAFLRSL
jgi:hypothetical protein